MHRAQLTAFTVTAAVIAIGLIATFGLRAF